MVDRDLRQMKLMLWAHSDLFLSSIFSFTVEDFSAWYGDAGRTAELKRVLDLWSYEFGDLKDYDAEHFILANSVHKRPFVKTGEHYFFPLATGFH